MPFSIQRELFNQQLPAAWRFSFESSSASASRENGNSRTCCGISDPRLAQQPEVQVLTQDSLGPTGRPGLADCAVRVNKTEGFELQTGFNEAYEEELPELALRLFCDLQVLRLLSIS